MYTKLSLQAITIRAIGPYLHGARLEIRPLTILCGKNGSGKSTWFKVLNMLLRSQEKGSMPWSFDVNDEDAEDVQFHNFAMLCQHYDDISTSGEEETNFGPLGTVGLEFQALDTLDLGASPCEQVVKSQPEQAFLWLGRVASGTRFRIRLAHPQQFDDTLEVPHLMHLIELRWNGNELVRFTTPLAVEKPGPVGSRSGWDYPDTSFAFSSCLVPGSTEGVGMVRRATFSRDVTLEASDLSTAYSNDTPLSIARTAALRIRQLLDRLFAGYFYISAVRDPIAGELALDHRSRGEMPPDIDFDTALRTRRVGARGGATWYIEREFAHNLLEQPENVEPALFTPGSVAQCADVIVRRPETRSHWRHLQAIASPEVASALKGISEDADDFHIAALAARFLNDILPHRNVYQANLWPQAKEDPEIVHYLERGIENLTRCQVMRLNRSLIETTLRGWPNSQWPNVVEAYVSYWLARLTGTRIEWTQHEVECLSDGWLEHDHPPNGHLLSDQPQWIPLPSEEFIGREQFDLSRFLHGCFASREPQPPRVMSAGFHQLAPIIVQTGLMRAGEILAVENPEVHLHPSLQLQTTELFLHQARAGKCVLLETHSDLIVRRVLREMLEERIGIGQENMRIYFADLSRKHTYVDRWETPLGEATRTYGTYHCATLERIQVNERGQIANWPEGFLDDDVKESQRLLDIMYGNRSEGEDEP